MIICDVCRQQLNDERYTGIFFKEDDMLKAEIRMDFCPNCYRTLTAIVQKAQTPKVDAADMELTITDEREDPKQSTAERLIKTKPRKLAKVKAKPKPKKTEAVEEVPETPAETEEELKDEKKPKYVDYGKIRALSEAGWPASEIAADVHCGVSTVYNYLAKVKKEVHE